MKNKHHQIILLGVMKILFIGFMFITISIGHAQSLQNWADPVNLSNSGGASDPISVIDAEGVFHVIWVDEIDGYKYVRSEDGTNWTSPITVNFPFSVDDDLPKFVADMDGSIHAVWRDEENVLYYSEADAEEFGDSGAWSIRTALAESALDFYIALDSKETLHLGYVRNISTDSNQAGIYYRRSPAGSGWTPGQNLYSSEYFRSLELENTHVRLSTVSGEIDDEVYIVWDDQPQKRIFMAASMDGGLTWSEAGQVMGPEDFTGYQYPFNVDISASESSILISWQVGEAGVQCSQYSQSTADKGQTWGEPIKILDEFLGCPDKSHFYTLDNNLTLILLDIQGEITLVAWDGNNWSDPQLQSEIYSFSNPATFDSVILGCISSSLFDNSLYIVGCDQGNSGDIWFTSRTLGSFENWFPPPSIWSLPGVITNTNQNISSLSSTSDIDKSHLFWVQSSQSEQNGIGSSIQYSHLADGEWTRPVSIFSNFNIAPRQISVAKDWGDRLVIAWIDGKTSDILFSWANAERANLPSEWAQRTFLPVESQLNSSPDILVDAAGRIVISYAVPINEGRGIYVIQSTDFGATWTQPVLVFDAVSAGVQRIDQPKIGLSGDGRLHLLFTEYSLQEGGRPVGLYYSQSVDGGAGWSVPELISERYVQWNDIIYNDGTLYRFWQEWDGAFLNDFYQISQDEGQTWTTPANIVVGSTRITEPVLVVGPNKLVHFIELTEENDSQLEAERIVMLQEWIWDGERWVTQGDGSNINIKGNDFNLFVTGEITLQGYLNLAIAIIHPEHESEIDNSIMNTGRSIEITGEIEAPSPIVIPAPEIPLSSAEIVQATDIPNIQTTPTEPSQPPRLPTGDSPSRQNLVGYIFVGIIVLVVFVFVIFGRKKKPE